jgi:predicted naringenin-chalcone synthase
LFVFYWQATTAGIGVHVAHAKMAQFANYVASVPVVHVAVIPTSLSTVGFSMKNQNKSSLRG